MIVYKACKYFGYEKNIKLRQNKQKAYVCFNVCLFVVDIKSSSQKLTNGIVYAVYVYWCNEVVLATAGRASFFCISNKAHVISDVKNKTTVSLKKTKDCYEPQSTERVSQSNKHIVRPSPSSETMNSGFN